MNNQTTATIRLSGLEALEFANSLYRPTHERIEQCREHLDFLDRNIRINRTNTGFLAEIEDLDLSFLDDSSEEKTMTIEVQFELSMQPIMYSTGEDYNSIMEIKSDNSYKDSLNDQFLPLAA